MQSKPNLYSSRSFDTESDFLSSFFPWVDTAAK